MSESRRVLLIADPHVPVPPVYYGGIERIVDFLAEWLQSRGWDVTLASSPDSTCPVRKYSLSKTKHHRVNQAANLLKVKYLTTVRRYDIVHSFGHIDLCAALWPSGRPIIQSFQAHPSLEILTKRMGLFPPRNLWFTVCGQHMVNHVSHLAPTRAIHNGVKIENFTFQGKVAVDAPLVFLGRIDPIKGTHTAIEIAKATNRRLVIAGNRGVNPELDSYFKNQIEPHLSDQITYIGPVDDSQKNRLLGTAAAFLMPIEWDEPFGIVMAEALACGTPVIGIARGALPEIVKHGVTGAACQTTQEMMQSVQSVDQFDRQACRLSAEKQFSADVIVEQYINYYDEILALRG